MPRERTQRAVAGRAARTHADTPSIPAWHTEALLLAYRIASHHPRDEWKAALEGAELTPEAREVVADYLRWAWKRDRTEAPTPEPYGKGEPVRMVFSRR